MTSQNRHQNDKWEGMIPPYVRMVKVIPVLGRYQPTTAYLLISVVLLLPYFVGTYLSGHSSNHNELLGMFFAVALISAGGVLLANAYGVVRSALDLMPSMFTTTEQHRLLRDHIQLMLCSPIQYGVAFAFGIVGAAISWRLDAGIQGVVNALFILYVFFAFVIFGFGLWLALTTLRWISLFPAYGQFRLFPIPSRTVALREASKVTGIFALSFSLEAGFGAVGLLTVQWANQELLQRTVALLVIPLAVLSAVFFIYPQLALMRIINGKKRELAGNLEKMMMRIDLDALADDLHHAAFQRIDKIVELHEKVSYSPSTALDLSTLSRFATSLLIPFTIFIKDSQVFERVLQFLLELLK